MVKILSAELAASAARPEDFPRSGLPEVAVLGRSNVGKSSLLNRMVSRRDLARTSSTPGKTRLVHFFEVRRSAGRLLLVDLPGYGWARASKTERRRWKDLVEGYLDGRAVLRVAIVLLDVRRDLSDDEFGLFDWLGERSVPAVLALTKVDKLRPGARARRLRELAEGAPLPAQRPVATSAEKGIGIDELWRVVNDFL